MLEQKLIVIDVVRNVWNISKFITRRFTNLPFIIGQLVIILKSKIKTIQSLLMVCLRRDFVTLVPFFHVKNMHNKLKLKRRVMRYVTLKKRLKVA